MDLNASLRYYGLRRNSAGATEWIRPHAPRPGTPIPTRTQESLAACAAVGLNYWSDAPGPNRLWALDIDRQPHEVIIDRRCHTVSSGGRFARWTIDDCQVAVAA